MRVKKDSRNFLISLKCSLQKLWNFLHAGKKSFWGSMFSLMTLQNSMDERKLKNYQAFNLSLLSLWVCVYVCVCVCVQGRPCVCEVEWRGLSFQCDSEEGWGRERERERQTNMACRDCVHTVTWIRWKQNCTSWQSAPNTQIYGECTTTKYRRSIPHLQLFQTRRN